MAKRSPIPINFFDVYEKIEEAIKKNSRSNYLNAHFGLFWILLGTIGRIWSKLGCVKDILGLGRGVWMAAPDA